VDYRTAIEATDELLPRMRLAYRLANSLLQVGQARDALQLCTDAAQQLVPLQGAEAVRVRAQLEGARARALIGIDQLADAAALCQQAIADARGLRLAHPTLAEKICTDAYRGLGYIARRQGRNADARPYFVRAVSHARSAGLHKEEAETLGYLSATLRELGDFAGALLHGEQALRVAQSAGNDYLAANLLHYMSITCYYHDQLPQALAYSQQAAILHQAMGDSEGMVSCDILQAVVYAAMVPLSAAVAAIERAHSDSQLFDNRWLQGMARYVYGIVHTLAGNLLPAEAALHQALALPAFTQDLPMAASARLFLGINSVAQGKVAQAQAMVQDLPDPCAIEVELLAGLFRGMAHLAAGDAAAANAVAEATRRRGQESGYLIYAVEAGRLLLASALPLPLAELPAFVCCEIHPVKP
jgi:tetratricopeptide (TPR) repeat protein